MFAVRPSQIPQTYFPAPSPPLGVLVKSKEGSRLVLQWRKPQETNGVIKKYILHFTNVDGENETYTTDSNLEKENVTYEMTLPDVEALYKIKVSGKSRLAPILCFRMTHNTLHFGGLFALKQWISSSLKRDKVLSWIVFLCKGPPKGTALWDGEIEYFRLTYFR